MKELLTAECRAFTPLAATDRVESAAVPTTSTSSATASHAEDDFFAFEPEPIDNYSAEKEVAEYLRSGYELEILNQFPGVRNTYMKYNTPTPSSAPVERLFSLGGLVLTPRRNRLSDRRFEKLLLMRFNHCFISEN